MPNQKPFTPEEKKKFDKIKKLTLDVVRALDNSKMLNYQRYEEMFDVFEKNPDEFRNWSVLHDTELDSTIQMYQLPFEEMKMQQIKKAADIEGIELENYIYFRQNDPRGVRSKMKCPVGYVHIKRVQQMLSKKNHYTTDIDERSLKSGDVKGESKVAAMSEPEVLALEAVGADKTLEELLGPRADNQQKKQQMYREIAERGYCSLDDLHSDRSSSTALNTINTYLIASGIRSDLITNTLQTEYTITQGLRKK